MVLSISNYFNSGIIVVLYNPFCMSYFSWETITTTGGEKEGYRFPVQLLMPYNYTLRHAVKCYTNNNINREQLQSQCKLYRRRVLKLQVCFRAKKKQHTKKKQIQHESQFIDTKENRRTKKVI